MKVDITDDRLFVRIRKKLTSQEFDYLVKVIEDRLISRIAKQNYDLGYKHGEEEK